MTEIQTIYTKIPTSSCVEKCFKCCINMVQFTPSELKAMGGYEYNGVCPHLIDGKCSIYENRPFVCRIYGTSELLKCDDCTPERFLSEDETVELVHQYTQLKTKEESEENVEN